MSRLFATARSALAGAVLLALAAPAAAQDGATPGKARGFFSAGVGTQAVSGLSVSNVRFDHSSFGTESGEVDSRHSGGSGESVEASGGFWVRTRFGIGAAVSRMSLRDDAVVTARIPHPFFFDRASTVEGAATGSSREETAVNLHLLWRIRTGGKVEVALFGGPTFFDVDQDLVSAVEFDRSYPYDAATLRGVTRQQASASATGYNVGVKADLWFGRRMGVAGTVRYSRASAELPMSDGRSVSTDLGGLQTLIGLQGRF